MSEHDEDKFDDDEDEDNTNPFEGCPDVHILHKNVHDSGLFCPVCGTRIDLEDPWCEDLLRFEVDIFNDDQTYKIKDIPDPVKAVRFLIDDAEGPFGGRIFMTVNIAGMKEDPKKLFWNTNELKVE